MSTLALYFNFAVIKAGIISVFFPVAFAFNVFETDFGTLIGSLYNIFYPIAIVLGVFFIMYAGYRITISEGEPNNLQDSKDALTAAIVGTLFVILAIVLLRIIITSLVGFSLPS